VNITDNIWNIPVMYSTVCHHYISIPYCFMNSWIIRLLLTYQQLTVIKSFKSWC
jgi:hypothetical protein